MKKIILVLILISHFVFAQVVPDKPINYITDVGDFLNEEQEINLNTKLKTFEDSTSNQIFVLVANSLNGEVLEDFTQDLFVKWKVGQKGKNNGVLITIFVTERKFRIHTGYGLEGVLPDVLTKQIQDETMIPHFKEGNYYYGINAGIDKLIKASKEEFKVKKKPTTTSEQIIAITMERLTNASKGNFEFDNKTTTQDVAVGLFFIFYVPNILFFILILVTNISKIENKGQQVILFIAAILLLRMPIIGLAVFVLWFIIGRTKFYKKLLLFLSKNRQASTYSSSRFDSDSSSSSSSDDSSSSFDGGGGGDSGGGGSSSSW